MLKAFIGLLILLFPLTALSVLCMIVEEKLAFHAVMTGTIILAVHLAVILGWYKLKLFVFPDSQRCSVCGRDIQLSGRQKCRGCGFRWNGHYFERCPNCGIVANLLHCPHCELSNKKPWWYDWWHKLN
jgi:hypothetical protein